MTVGIRAFSILTELARPPPSDDPHFENGLADREGERAGTESTEVGSALVAYVHQMVADGVRKHRL